MAKRKSIAKATTGNLFQQLGFSPDESVALKMRAELHSSIVEVYQAPGLQPGATRGDVRHGSASNQQSDAREDRQFQFGNARNVRREAGRESADENQSPPC